MNFLYTLEWAHTISKNEHIHEKLAKTMWLILKNEHLDIHINPKPKWTPPKLTDACRNESLWVHEKQELLRLQKEVPDHEMLNTINRCLLAAHKTPSSTAMLPTGRARNCISGIWKCRVVCCILTWIIQSSSFVHDLWSATSQFVVGENLRRVSLTNFGRYSGVATWDVFERPLKLLRETHITHMEGRKYPYLT